jgi:L-ascorbate metabolism protein UlaG (beta-lactamase superfamily)
MPVGAYNPWHAVHCNPEEAWQMGNDASSEFFIPVHHQTFQLSREPLLEPIERLYAVAGRQSDRIAITKIGEEFRI